MKLSTKHTQKVLDQAKQSATDAYKATPRFQSNSKNSEVTGDMIVNKIAEKQNYNSLKKFPTK